jgi:undecaprenyl-diphosphatase
MQESNLIQWLLLALVQGLTEYLPISSSAHLILISKIMNWEDQGQIIDIAAHGGSLMAVIWYFKKEIVKLFKGKNWPLFIQLTIASIPIAIVGFLFADQVETYLRSPLIIAVASIVFGLILYYSDKLRSKCQQKQITMNYKQVMLIGLSQVFALIPGASRSGVTMSMAMAQGFSRTKAAEFSFLLAIPTLLMTTGYGVLKLYKQPESYDLMAITIVFIVSFFASILSIKLFLNIIEKISIATFVWYRIILAGLIIWYLY